MTLVGSAIQVVAFLALVFNSTGMLYEQWKPEVLCEAEQDGDLVILRFSAEFPILNDLEKASLCNVVLHKSKARAVRMVKPMEGTEITILVYGADDPKAKKIFDIIKGQLKELVKMKLLPSPRPVPGPPPDASPPRVVLFKKAIICTV